MTKSPQKIFGRTEDQTSYLLNTSQTAHPTDLVGPSFCFGMNVPLLSVSVLFQQMAHVQTAPPYYSLLSEKLCDILDEVGVSEENRRQLQEMAKAHEISTRLNLCSISFCSYMVILGCYIFGSLSEGSCTYGSFSDMDILWFIGFVHQDNSQWTDDCFLHLVQDETTPAGYCKLQLLHDRVKSAFKLLQIIYFLPRVFTDDNGRSFLGNTIMGMNHLLHVFKLKQLDKHGPAITTTPETTTILPVDNVYAFKCKSWPDSAAEWLSRPRRYNWPPAHLIDKMKEYGFFLVPVGHSKSRERALEWRISLSLQERLLMFNLSLVQLKCYVLLKLTKKAIIEPMVGEESLSSYHCKTCLFYMIENTPTEFWRKDNLLTCLMSCLEQIADWVKGGVCPNYFIPEENMFDGRLNCQTRTKLAHALSLLIQSNCKFLITIKIDDIGKQINSFCSNAVLSNSLSKRVEATYFNVLRKQLRTCIYYSTLVLNNVPTLLQKQITTSSEQMLKYLSEVRAKVTEYREKETRDILSLTLPYLELNLLTKMATEAKRANDTDKLTDILFSGVWHKISLQSDCLSAKLKQAMYLCVTGFEGPSLDVLQPISNVCQNLMSLCLCSQPTTYFLKGPWLEVFLKGNTENVTKELFFHQYLSPCISISMSEKDIIPEGLVFALDHSEDSLIRSDYIPLLLCDMCVDGKILLHFLLYLNHRKLGMVTDAQQDVVLLQWYLENDVFLGHKDTGYFLLGWCLNDQSQ